MGTQIEKSHLVSAPSIAQGAPAVPSGQLQAGAAGELQDDGWTFKNIGVFLMFSVFSHKFLSGWRNDAVHGNGMERNVEVCFLLVSISSVSFCDFFLSVI